MENPITTESFISLLYANSPCRFEKQLTYESFKSALLSLKNLAPNPPECNMINITLSYHNTFYPELVQIIKLEEDYVYQHISHKKHKIIEKYNIDPLTFVLPFSPKPEHIIELQHGIYNIDW